MSTVDLILFSAEPWGPVWGRNQYLLAGLLRERPQLRALFVEPAADPWQALAHAHRPRLGRGLASLHDVPGVHPGQLWRFQPTQPLRILDRSADSRTATAVARAARRIGFNEPVLWINDPEGAILLAATGWPALYDITGATLGVDRPASELERMLANEDFLLREADEVVVSSEAVAASKVNGRAYTVIPDADGAPLPRPADLPAGPVAVYAGITDRLDLELCATVARALLEVGAQLVLVRPAPLARPERAHLEAAGAVLLTADLPGQAYAYLDHADVLVAPYIIGAFAERSEPAELHDYLLTGRPVVSTLDRLDAGIVVATGQAFVEAVLDALASPPPRRSHRTGAPAWAERTHQMAAVLDRLSRATLETPPA